MTAGDSPSSHLATIKPRRDAPTPSAWRVPALTILYHPGAPDRAGEVARLVGLLEGKACALSRGDPAFQVPGAAAGAPLDDRHVSRTPVRIAPDGAGGVQLEAPAGLLRIDGASAAGRVALSREALDRGAVLELCDRVVLLLHRVGPPAPRAPALGMVGGSEALERVRGEVLRIADLDVPVLLRGETGTGKELVARAIAQASPRRGPFVGVNLAAVPASIAASELFGHAAGAFTGASGAHAGYFAQAQGGTLFLDEVGAAPLEVQAMLLRALETREIQPLGSEKRREVEVRILAATDEDLEVAVREGRFREALHQRLCGYHLDVPPLRVRRDDLGALLVHFLGAELDAIGERGRLRELAGSDPWLPPAVVARLALCAWPGNVRQLAGAVRRLVVETRGGRRADEAALAPILRSCAAEAGAPGAEAERPEAVPVAPSAIGEERLQAALRDNGWRIGATARALGISRTSLYALIEASPSIRKAKDVPEDELRACHEATGGDVEAMAERLRVSSRGIRLRLKELGLG